MPQVNNATITGACVAEQRFLVDVFGKNVPAGRDTGDFGVFQALLNSNNIEGVTITELLTGMNAKRRTVTLYYDKAQCFEVCAKVGTCSTVPAVREASMGELNVTIANKFTVCDVNPTTSATENIALSMDAATWDKFCVVNDGEKWQKDIANYDYRLFVGLNKLLAQEINTIVPATHVKSVQITVVNATTQSTLINPNLQFYIEQLLRNAGMNDKEYFILGGSKIKQLESLKQIQAASTEGFDLTKQGDLGMMFYSKAWDVVAPNSLIILPYKTVQLITYAENRGSFKAMTELVTRDTKLFPIGNGGLVEFDYHTVYDPTCAIRKYDSSLLMELVKTVPGGCNVANAVGLPIFKLEDCQAMPTLECAN